MNFASDNWAGVHPAIAEGLTAASTGFAPAYGGSDLDRKALDRIAGLFGGEAEPFFVATGTAANSLGLAAVARSGGVVFCHRESHLVIDEGGAAEFLASGTRLRPVDGAGGRLDPERLEAAIAEYPREAVRHGQPMAVSITQATEIGTVYSIDQIKEIAGICAKHEIPLHMDGARFANALVSLGATAQQMTRDAGVDILSFGATKNGCWCAEAVVFLRPELVRDFAFIRHRSAQNFSKSRFIAAQFMAYLENGLWLELAAHANSMAQRLASSIAASDKTRLAWAPEANEVFAVIPERLSERLRAAGTVMYPWTEPAADKAGLREGETIFRLVTSFATTSDEVDRFSDLLHDKGT